MGELVRNTCSHAPPPFALFKGEEDGKNEEE